MNGGVKSCLIHATEKVPLELVRMFYLNSPPVYIMELKISRKNYDPC